jgi:hypothetical protein
VIRVEERSWQETGKFRRGTHDRKKGRKAPGVVIRTPRERALLSQEELAHRSELSVCTVLGQHAATRRLAWACLGRSGSSLYQVGLVIK